MIVIGLTGSIGMGKSTASSMLRAMGIPVHDSDQAVRALISPGGAAIDALGRLFPEVYDSSTGSIDRAALGQIVFRDDEKRRMLEGVLHPLVHAAQAAFLEQERNRGSTLVVLDIPLLYETGGENRVDKVIVVTAPAFIQRRRVLKRPGMSDEKFDGILRSQMPDAEKCARADYIVPTGFGETYTRHALKKIIEGLRHDQKRDNLPPYAR